MILPNWLSIRNNLQEIHDSIDVWNPLVWSILTSLQYVYAFINIYMRNWLVEHVYRVGLLNWHTVCSDLSLTLWVVGLNWERIVTHSIFILNTDQISNSCWTCQFYLTMECYLNQEIHKAAMWTESRVTILDLANWQTCDCRLSGKGEQIH